MKEPAVLRVARLLLEDCQKTIKAFETGKLTNLEKRAYRKLTIRGLNGYLFILENEDKREQ